MPEDLIKQAIEKKKLEEPTQAPPKPEAPVETRRLYIIRNVVVNSIMFALHWLAIRIEIQATKLKVLYFVYFAKARRFVRYHKQRIQNYIAGYRRIDADKFLAMFPPKKGHKPCNYGTGWMVVQLPNKTKAIRFCHCVTEQYKKSGKRLIINQPGA